MPKDEWICNRCRVLEAIPNMPVEEIKCGICLSAKGILCASTCEFDPNLKWAHPLCVNWIPHFLYDDDGQKTKINAFSGAYKNPGWLE